MSNAGYAFTKYLTQPVPPATSVPVELVVGDERQSLHVSRPTRFTALTLVSREGRSKHASTRSLAGPRRFAKQFIRHAAPAIRTGVFFDTRHIEPNNIAHLLIEIVPLCLTARKAIGDVTFIFRPLSRRFQELLNYFGIEPLCTQRPVSGEKLEFHLSRELAQYEIGTLFDCPFLTLTGDVYADFIAQTPGPRKIYLSRKGPRSLINEGEVRAFLEARGYVAIHLEEHSIADQIMMMQAAEDIVAIHGAALGYLALTKRIRSVVELLPPNVYHNFFPISIGDRVERFVQLIPSFDENTQFAGWSTILQHKQGAFGVDLNQLRRALD